MALEGLRILSGLILPQEGERRDEDDQVRRFREQGSADIMFNPHDIRSDDAEDPFVEDIQSFGPAGPFINEPNKIVALRDISVTHVDDSGGGFIGFEQFEIGLDDTFIRRRGDIVGLNVSWNTTSRVFDDNRGEPGRERFDETRPTPVEIREISYMIIGEVDEDATDEDFEGDPDAEDK